MLFSCGEIFTTTHWWYSVEHVIHCLPVLCVARSSWTQHLQHHLSQEIHTQTWCQPKIMTLNYLSEKKNQKHWNWKKERKENRRRHIFVYLHSCFTIFLTYLRPDKDTDASLCFKLLCVGVITLIQACSWEKYRIHVYTYIRGTIPLHAIWSLWGFRPPVHRKFSVTATCGSSVSMPSASSACLMHSPLCISK